jgi:hypothetical protein
LRVTLAATGEEEDGDDGSQGEHGDGVEQSGLRWLRARARVEE